MAAKKGFTEVFIWLTEQCTVNLNLWDNAFFRCAVENRHIGLAEWLFVNGNLDANEYGNYKNNIRKQNLVYIANNFFRKVLGFRNLLNTSPKTINSNSYIHHRFSNLKDYFRYMTLEFRD